MVLVPVIFIGWGATAIATNALITVSVSTLVPLLVLAAGYEAVFALHVNVERVGRYLQVFHEQSGGWEHVAMRFGQRFPGSGPDPLFSRLFTLAVSINFIPVLLVGEIPEIVVLAILNLIFINRVRLGRQFAARQRSEDVTRFQSIREEDARP